MGQVPHVDGEDARVLHDSGYSTVELRLLTPAA